MKENITKFSKERLNLERVKRIEEKLKEIVQNGKDLQNNYTPPEICDMMLDKLDLTGDKSILVLYTIEILFELRKLKYKGQVTFFTQSLSKKELAEKLLPGVIVQYIDIEENPLYFMENNWPEKFDIIVANPPYSKKLDLKFLDKAFDLAKEEVVFVHPSSYLIDRKKIVKIFISTRDKTKDYIKSILFFNGNGIFNIELQVPCMITVFDKKSKREKFNFENLIYKQKLLLSKDKIEDLSIFGYNDNFLSIEKKLINYLKISGNSSLQDNGHFNGKKMEHLNSYFVEFSQIMGRSIKGKDISKSDILYKKDTFVAISKNQLQVKYRDKPKYNIVFEFISDKEAQNFIYYMKTNFFRFCLALKKTNQNLDNGELRTIPWLDFTQEWTDEKLYKHFNITEEEQAFIKEVIPSYYD